MFRIGTLKAVLGGDCFLGADRRKPGRPANRGDVEMLENWNERKFRSGAESVAGHRGRAASAEDRGRSRVVSRDGEMQSRTRHCRQFSPQRRGVVLAEL